MAEEEDKKSDAGKNKLEDAVDGAVAQVTKQLGSLRTGDYMVHVLIQEARQLTPKEKESTVNPMVEVAVFNQKRYTSVKEKIGGSGTCFWGEHLFFEKNGLRASTAEMEKIKIRLFHKSTFKKDTIGSYEFDLTYVYFNDKHCIQHMWLALTDVGGEDFQKITGYLKVSIAVIATGDEQVELKEDEGVDKTDESMLLMPPQVRTQQYQLVFRFAKAEYLPKMDTFGGCDGFVKIEFLNQKIKTNWKKQKDDQLWWNEELYMPANVPVVASRILLKIFDYDAGSADELIGSIITNFRHIQGKYNKVIRWENIYGAPPGKTGKNTKLMNRNPEVASTWKGRVLMQYECYKTDEAYLKRENIQPNKLIRDPPKRKFTLKAQFRQAVCLPGQNEKFSIKIKIAEFEFETKRARVSRGDLNSWNQGFYETVMLPYFTIEEVERVYVYLMEGDTPVCYRRFDVDQIADKNPEFRWLGLINDKSIGKVDEHYKAGILQMRLYFGLQEAGEQGSFKSWPSRMRSDDDVHNIIVHAFQCRDLPAADDNGVSDPYLKIQNFGGKDDFKTATIEDSINPIYYESIAMFMQYNDIHLAPPLVVDIYDYDTFSSDDFIGRALAYLDQFEYEEDPDTPGKPRWVPVTPGIEKDQPMGELLVGINVLDPELEVDLRKLNIMMRPETTKIDVEINILGLRGLQSTGILPVKKPFIKFNLNSLVPPGEGGVLQNIQTQPSASGKNANINSVIKFKVKLPIDSLYCPKIACAVYDYIFKGLSQPLLGTFSVPIGDMMQDQRETLMERLQKMDYALGQIGKKLEEVRLNPKPLHRQIEVEEDLGVSTARDGVGLLNQNSQRSEDINLNKVHIEMQNLQPDAQPLRELEIEEEKQAIQEVPASLKMGEEDAPPQRQFLAKLIKKNLDFDINAYQRERKYLGKFLMYPQYKFDEKLKFMREINPPPADLFYPLGYDPQKDAKIKHYRRSYETELEEVDDCLGPTPFDVFEIFKGRSRNIAKQDFDNIDPEALKIPVVGTFKGLIKVESKALMAQLQMLRDNKIGKMVKMLQEMHEKVYGEACQIDFEELDTIDEKKKLQKLIVDVGLQECQIIKHLHHKDKYAEMSKQLLVPTKCIVRVYIIEAFGLPPKDTGSDSDPYLILKLGKKKIKDREDYKEDNSHPQWHKHFDFETTMPGDSILNIQVWDRDVLFSDDFIGETSIDIEDRFFSPRWNSIVNKPVELRSLFAPTSTVQQGQIRLWVEIHPANVPPEKLIPWNIQPRPSSEFQIRLCVYSTKNVKTFDIEGTSDIYIRAYMDSDNPHETDVHYRCQNGKGSFNWRMLFDVKFPRKKYYLNLQIWDKDFFSGNDYIADAAINFEKLANDVYQSGKGLSLDKKYYMKYMKPQNGEDPIKWEGNEQFWIPCRSKDPKTGEFTDQGSILVRMDIIEMTRAKSNPVGKGRSEPNHSPYLPPPTGRISWTWNPFKMINQLIGPEWRKKFYMLCCCICCIIICIALAPLIFSNLVSSAIVSIF